MIEADNTKNKIGERAYRIFEQRGGTPGHALEDWLQAERELMDRSVEKVAELTKPQAVRSPKVTG